MSLLDPLTSEYFRAGWARWLLPDSLFLYRTVICAAEEGIEGELTDAPEGSQTAAMLATIGGLDSEISVGDADEPADPDETDWRRIIDRAGEHYGLTITTHRDLLELMRRVGVVTVESDDGVSVWRPTHPVPLPSERLSLSSDEVAHEDAMRWRELHEETAQAVIRLFQADDGVSDDDRTTLTFSLTSLGDQLDQPPEDVRQGLLNLLKDGDFTASKDLERIGSDDKFTLTVDWKAFAATRISIVASHESKD